MLRARRRFPRYIVGLLVLACLIAAGLRASTSTSSSNIGSTWLVDPPITYAEVRARAEASSGQPASPPSQSSLVELVNRSIQLPPGKPPGRRLVEMAWTTQLGPVRTRESLRSIGWPMPWVSIRRYYAYTDPYFMTGLKRSVTDPSLRPLPPNRHALPFENDVRRVPPYPRFEWFGDMVRYQLPPEATGGQPLIASIHFITIVGTLGLLVAVWCLAALLIRFIRRAVRQPRHPRTLRLARFIPLIAALLAGILIIALAWLGSASRFPPVPYSSVTRIPGAAPGAARLSFDTDQLAALRGPEADRALAAAIIAQIPPPQDEPKDDSILVVGWYPEFHSSKLSVTRFDLGPFLPIAWAYRTTYVTNPAVTDPQPFRYHRGPAVSIVARMGLLRYSSGRPAEPTYMLLLDLAHTGAVVMFIWLMWLVARAAIIISQRTHLRRRARHGLCLNCRYPLPAAQS